MSALGISVSEGAPGLTITLQHPNELFDQRPPDVAAGMPPGLAGIEQIRDALDAGSRRPPALIAFELPSDQATPRAEQGVRRALSLYCENGIEHAENELRAIRRDGLQTLLLGAVMLAAFLLLSEAVLRSHAPLVIRDFFGNGLFLVAAWVGLWYPLDTLVYAGRPFRRERKLLQAIRAVEIVVRPVGAA